MNKSYKLLIIGNPYDNHMARFVKYLKRENPQVSIDFFWRNIKGKDVLKDTSANSDNIYLADFSIIFPYVLRFAYKIELKYKIRKAFRKLISDKRYNIVNIQYPTVFDSFLISDIRGVSNMIFVTPWGSDVYRSSNWTRRQLQRIYDSADYVTGNGDRFTDDVFRIFNVSRSKYVFATLGAETIDFICDHKNEITQADAKSKLGIDNCYVITCGYNGSQAQQHLKILESLYEVKDNLPSNLILLFPLTYSKKIEYIKEIKDMVRQYGFNAIYFEDYMDMERLLVMRVATDMFIHVQTTDANSATLKEYIILKKNCINGGWLKYPDMEKQSVYPYHIAESYECLSKVILEAYKNGPQIITDKLIEELIKRYSYRSVAENWNKLLMSKIID